MAATGISTIVITVLLTETITVTGISEIIISILQTVIITVTGISEIIIPALLIAIMTGIQTDSIIIILTIIPVVVLIIVTGREIIAVPLLQHNTDRDIARCMVITDRRFIMLMIPVGDTVICRDATAATTASQIHILV